MSLLWEVIEGRGSLELQRSLQKQRLADPSPTPEAHLHIYVRAEAIRRGVELCEQLQQDDIHWVSIDEPDYPHLLKQIADPPVGLFYRGRLAAIHKPSIALVGSRSCTSYGQGVTRTLASSLSRCGFTIISGLALGIDATAHQATLESRGLTAAILGTGIDNIYPKTHRNLADRIVAAGGTLLSEFPPGTQAKPFHFPIRNRVISGCCHATIVIEAEQKSGSLITARHALDQGRELFAVPGPIDKPSASGTNYLIKMGTAQLITSAEDVLDALTPLVQMAASHEKTKSICIDDGVAQRIYDGLDAFDARPLEFIVAESELPVSEVMAKLIHLESLNLVVKKPGPFYLRNPVHV